MTQPMWAADISIDAQLASMLVRAQFPDLRVDDARAIGIGWDNAAFLVDGKIVFRFPRRRVAVPLIEREIAILPEIRQRVTLPISAPTFFGVAGSDYPWPFAGYELIAGRTSCSFDFSDDDRRALAEPLGTFLRGLHAIDPAPLVARGLPPDEIGRLDPVKRMTAVRERLPRLSGTGVEHLDECVAWMETHAPRPLADRDRRLVHGDLYARHVLLDDRLRPSGVIDWGDVHYGDPALDIAIAHLMLPQIAHADFRAAYGRIDDRTWNAAKYRAIYHAILVLDYGTRADDPGMKRIGIDALRLIGESDDRRRVS